MADELEIVEKFVEFFNCGSYIDDPLGSDRGTDGFAFDKLRTTSGKFPKIHVYADDDLTNFDYSFGPNTQFQQSMTVLLYFYCKPSKENWYIDPTDGKAYGSDKLVKRYLIKMRNAIKNNTTCPLLAGYGLFRYGSISNPVLDQEQGLWMGMLPVNVSWRDP